MPPKKAKTTKTPAKSDKKETKSKKRKQKVSSDSDDEDFKADDFSDEDFDAQEEKHIRKQLSAAKLNEGSDFGGSDIDDIDDETTPQKKKGKKARQNADKDTGKKSRGGSGSKPIQIKKAKSKDTNSRYGQIIVKGKSLDKGDDDEANLLDQPHDFSLNQNATEDDAYIPVWAKEPQIRDKKMRYSTDPNYDPTTLYIPPDDFKKLTPVLQQYWRVKADNLDKLVAMKVWKFYYFYFQDAIIVHKLIDMKLTLTKNWTTTFFHESCMSRFAPKLLDQGYQIAIVEQMEEINTSKKDVIRREICQILTRGTCVDHNPADYSSRFMMVIFEEQLKFGIVLLDSTTHEFYIGEIHDDDNRSNLRTAVTRLKPIEAVYMKGYIKNDTVNLLKFLPSKPTLTALRDPAPLPVSEILQRIGFYFKSDNSMDTEANFPELITMMKDGFETGRSTQPSNNNSSQEPDEVVRDRLKPFFCAFQALNMSLSFLQSVMLDGTVFTMGQFLHFDVNIQKQSSLFMDAQALQNLEILEVSYLNTWTEQNSLFSFMDYTKSHFGRRMYKRWLTAPLLNVDIIKERQDAVDDLIANIDVAEYFQDKLGKLPDLERMISRVYNLSNKQRMSAIYFEDFAKNRLKDFLEFLKELKTVENLIDYFADYIERFSSKRLQKLVTFKDVDIESFTKKKRKSKSAPPPSYGIFPRINDIISDLENMVEIKQNVPTPAPGISKENDVIMGQIKKVKDGLNGHLEEQRKYFKEKNINYVHSKHRFELEIPEDLVDGKKRPQDFTITSKRKGFLRFHDSFIETQIRKLYELESEFQKVLIPFIVDYFRKFYERHSLWNQVILCLGELDCLCSLARLALTMPTRCRPVIRKSDEPIFDLKQMIHPCIAKSGVNFVPNDTVFEEDKNIFLVTGPNMGGKSTLLRQTCIAIVMAQVGSWVPAEALELTPVDRIFTRIGASDRILEGKSTFFVEMEETLNIVRDATKNSFVILDELGRGTSTYDGVAIAHAVLKYLADDIRCYTLFATHYHLLLDEFALFDNVLCYHMACEFDHQKDVVKFLYKFAKGNAMSFGINVAKMAGLPLECVSVAKEKADLMVTEKKNIFSAKSITGKFNKIVAALEANDQNGFENHESALQLLTAALDN